MTAEVPRFLPRARATRCVLVNPHFTEGGRANKRICELIDKCYRAARPLRHAGVHALFVEPARPDGMSIEADDRVTLEYVGRFPDGTVFDTSRESVAVEHGLVDTDRETSFEPLTFVVGAEQVIEGLDGRVRDLSVGDEATLEIPPEEAYGPVDDARIREYETETFAGMVGQEPEVGLHVHAENGLHGDVIAVTEETVEVDFNHELAGKTLVFEVEILAVE